MIHLRPYQTQAIDQMRALMRKGCKSILYQGATGSGKTALTAHMLHTAAGKGMRSLFVVHRRELIKQSAEAFDKEGLKYGIVAAGFIPERHQLVQIASVGTLSRRLNHSHAPTLIVFDEAHHLAASSWSRIYSHFPNAYKIGITATPERLDGRGLSSYFKELLCGPSVRWLIDNGYLAPYKLYAPQTIDTTGLHMRMGDYNSTELVARVDRPTITGSALEHYKRLANGKRAIVFAVSVQHSRNIVTQFQAAGIPSAHVDGETETEVRDETIQKFRDGSISVLSNCDLFSEGFDVPQAECAILLRPTQSLTLYLQAIGRVLRPSPEKTAVVLDHAGNCQRHGLPDDPRDWSLEGSERRKGNSVGVQTSVRICPRCFAAQQAGQPACRFCGFVFEVKPREVREKDGSLAEVDVEAFRKTARREQGMTESIEDLTRLGIQRGYRYPRRWAYYVFKSRQAKRLGKVA